mmetsp:Transcript_34669/g.110146  ORF Transcript_34669/g.110146 Transcript_34669/m.110146 type:complete len:228 (+) Transcript_34669:315-998(+)
MGKCVELLSTPVACDRLLMIPRFQVRGGQDLTEPANKRVAQVAAEPSLRVHQLLQSLDAALHGYGLEVVQVHPEDLMVVRVKHPRRILGDYLALLGLGKGLKDVLLRRRQTAGLAQQRVPPQAAARRSHGGRRRARAAAAPGAHKGTDDLWQPLATLAGAEEAVARLQLLPPPPGGEVLRDVREGNDVVLGEVLLRAHHELGLQAGGGQGLAGAAGRRGAGAGSALA